MTQTFMLAAEIKRCVASGVSLRAAAIIFGVSLRQVQKAVNPEQRKRFDSAAHRKKKHGPDYWKRWLSSQGGVHNG